MKYIFQNIIILKSYLILMRTFLHAIYAQAGVISSINE